MGFAHLSGIAANVGRYKVVGLALVIAVLVSYNFIELDDDRPIAQDRRLRQEGGGPPVPGSGPGPGPGHADLGLEGHHEDPWGQGHGPGPGHGDLRPSEHGGEDPWGPGHGDPHGGPGPGLGGHGEPSRPEHRPEQDIDQPESQDTHPSGDSIGDDEEVDLGELPAYHPRSGHIQLGTLRRLLNTTTMQPFYLMPLTSCVQVAVPFALTGFELRFAASKEGNDVLLHQPPTPHWSERIMNNVGGLALIYGTLNSWYCDLLELYKLPSATWLEYLLALAVIAVTSPNYVQAVALCTPRILQSPATLLNATPKFQYGPYGVPLKPGQSWLHWTAHLATILLLPYFAMRWVLKQIVRGFMGGAFILVLLVLFGFGVASLGLNVAWHWVMFELRSLASFVASGLGVLVTAGMWGQARSDFLYYWSIHWPPFYFLLVQIWATLVAPWIFTRLFAAIYRVKTGFEKLREEKAPLGREFVRRWYQGYKPIESERLSSDQLQEGMKALALEPLTMAPFEVRTMRRFNRDKEFFFDFAHDFEGNQLILDKEKNWIVAVKHQHPLQRKMKGAYWQRSWQCKGCGKTEKAMGSMFRCELDACSFALCDACHDKRVHLARLADRVAEFQKPQTRSLLVERTDELQDWILTVQHPHTLEKVKQGWFWRSSWTCAGCGCREKDMGKFMHRCSPCKFALCHNCYCRRSDTEFLEAKAESEEVAELMGHAHLEENLERMQCTIVQLTLMSTSLIAVEQLAWFVTARFVLFLDSSPPDLAFEDKYLGLIAVIRMTILERGFIPFIQGLWDQFNASSWPQTVRSIWSVV